MLAYILVYLPFYHALYFLSMSNHENSTTKNEPKTLKDKPFWAVYLNMARHNAYVVLAHISQKLGEKTSTDEGKWAIMPCLEVLRVVDGTTLVKATKSVELLKKHFPFLDIVMRERTKDEKEADDKRREEANKINKPYRSKQIPTYKTDEILLVYQTMIKFLTLLEDFRNANSHQDEKEKCKWRLQEEDKEIAQNLWLALVNKSKEEILESIKELKKYIVRRDCFETLEDLFSAAVNRCKSKFSFIDDDIEHLKLNGEGGRKSPFHYDFFEWDAFKGKKVKGSYTDKGLAFFICLFIEKKYAYPFLQQIKGFKANFSSMYRATKAAFTEFAIRLPKQRINDIVSDPICFALDMLNELPKAPALLFPLLDEVAQKGFYPKKTNTIANETLEYKHLIDQAPFDNLKRKKNRFSFFALLYIDHQKLLGNFRFHIDLGVFHYKQYNRTNVYNTEVTESAAKKVHGFEYLPDLDKEKEPWKDLIYYPSYENEADNKPELPESYLTNTAPHYHITDGQIGLRENAFLPQLEKGKKFRNEKPDFMISEAELPALVFLLYCQKEHGKIEEQLVPHIAMKQYKIELHKFYKDLTQIKKDSLCKEELIRNHIESHYPFKVKFKGDTNTAKNLKDNDMSYWGYVSDDIITYLLTPENEAQQKQKFEKHATQVINLFIAETERLLQQSDRSYEKQQQNLKRGKKNANPVKVGQQAKWLADDMLRLQPTLLQGAEKGTDKLNATDFQELQRKLALYYTYQQELKHTFTAAKLIDSPNAHPFLAKIDIDKCPYLPSFYDNYLEERLVYFQKCQSEKKYDTYYFLKGDAKKWKDPFGKFHKDTEMEDRLLNEPINIPRGFFMNLLKKWFAKYENEAMKKLATTQRTDTKGHKHALNLKDTNGANTVFLIQQYMDKMRNGDTAQFFYALPKKYHLTYSKLQKRDFICNPNDLQKFTQDLAEQKSYHKDNKDILRQIVEINEKEKQLRLIKVQDMLIFLMAEDILFDKKDITHFDINKQKFQLKNVKIIAEKEQTKEQNKWNPVRNETNLLSVGIDITLPYKCKAMNHRGDNLDNIKGTVTIFQKDLKIKNYGDFIRFTHDRRINSLFLWLKSNSQVKREDLETELFEYDTRKMKLFEAILTFEQTIHKCMSEELEEVENLKQRKKDLNFQIRNTPVPQNYSGETRKLFDEQKKEQQKEVDDLDKEIKKFPVKKDNRFDFLLYVYFKKYNPELLIEKEKGIEEIEINERYQVKHIRNAFMHNQYPRPQQIGLEAQHRDSVTGIAKEITEKGKALFQRYIDAMKG